MSYYDATYVRKHFGVEPVLDYHRGTARVHIPGYAVAVGQTHDDALQEAVRLARDWRGRSGHLMLRKRKR